MTGGSFPADPIVVTNGIVLVLERETPFDGLLKASHHQYCR
jgi:hypothetical protein